MRLVNRLLGALLALGLMAGGILLIIDVVAWRTTQATVLPDWRPGYTWAATHPWSTSIVRVICGALVGFGLLLLIAELWPPRVRRVPAAGEDVDAAYTRRGLAAAVRSAVIGVDGVRRASVSVHRRRVRVEAVPSAPGRGDPEAVREAVSAAARDRLAALRLRRTPALSVRVRRRR